MNNINFRRLGRIVLTLMAITTTVGALVAFFDHAKPDLRRPLQSIAMALLTIAWIQAIRCLED